MALVTRPEPYSGLNFELTIEGVSQDGQAVGATFKEVSGFDSTVEVIEYRSGADSLNVIKIPGLNKHGNITLKWGANGTALFWNWILRAMDGQVQRANGSIKLLDENRVEVMRWDFTRAWPTKYTGPSLNASTNEIGLETLEMAVEKMRLVTA
jgi:phage tail-like protein